MSRYFFTLMIVISFFGKIQAQETVSDNAILAKTTLYDFELNEKQFAAWKSIKNNWLVGDYEKIKSENKIKITCKDCESFYLNVIIKINESGKMEFYKVIKGKRCSIDISKELELRMMRNFFKFEFPPELRNVTFQTTLGSVLKC